MKTFLLLIVVALANSAHATPRRMVIASGDCKDAELSSQTKALHDTLRSRPNEDVLSAAEFSERLFPQPSRSFEDIQRLLDAAQGQFYEGQYNKATQTLDDALKEIARLPPGDSRWKLYVSAQLLHGLNYRSINRVKESDAAFRQVLRIAPQYKLDPTYYAPSTRQAFEKVRREIASGRKVRLAVKSTLPTSDVYLDGFKVGQTPLAIDVPAGTYEIALTRGSAVSFPRQIQVSGPDTPITIDLAYEGSVTSSPFPCLAAQEKDDTTFSYANRLGGGLGVDEVIVVRLQPLSSGPKWLSATVLTVEGGQKLREGGLKTQGLDTQPAALNALVDFVTTGKTVAPVGHHPDDQGRGTQPPIAQGPTITEGPTNPLDNGPDFTAPDRINGGRQTVGPTSVTASRSASGLRVASYVVMGAGVAAAGAAGVVRLMAQQDYNDLKARLNAQGRINANDSQAIALRNSLASKSNAMTGLLIGSGAAIVTGGVMYLLSPSHSAPPVSVGVSMNGSGASASLSGSF